MAAGTATMSGNADDQTRRSEKMIRQDSGQTEWKEIFSERILTNCEEGEKIWVLYRGMFHVMNSGFVLTAIIQNPDEDNKEISVHL